MVDLINIKKQSGRKRRERVDLEWNGGLVKFTSITSIELLYNCSIPWHDLCPCHPHHPMWTHVKSLLYYSGETHVTGGCIRFSLSLSSNIMWREKMDNDRHKRPKLNCIAGKFTRVVTKNSRHMNVGNYSHQLSSWKNEQEGTIQILETVM